MQPNDVERGERCLALQRSKVHLGPLESFGITCWATMAFLADLSMSATGAVIGSGSSSTSGSFAWIRVGGLVRRVPHFSSRIDVRHSQAQRLRTWVGRLQWDNSKSEWSFPQSSTRGRPRRSARSKSEPPSLAHHWRIFREKKSFRRLICRGLPKAYFQRPRLKRKIQIAF